MPKININIRLLSMSNMEKWISEVEKISSKHNNIENVTIDVVEGASDIFKNSLCTIPLSQNLILETPVND